MSAVFMAKATVSLVKSAEMSTKIMYTLKKMG